MTIDIFIRTYPKDKQFLAYCLKSIAKFVTGYDKLLVVLPEGDGSMLTEIINEFPQLDFKRSNGESLVVDTREWMPLTHNGYIDQQISKLNAHKFSDATHILYVDSDCVFTQPTDLSDFFINGKPFLLKTKWESVGDAICWKQPTESILGFNTTHEHMRRLPMMLNRETLVNFNNKFDTMKFATREKLSEFNLLGAFAAHYEHEHYTILDTEIDPLPPAIAKQFWSWGGTTEEVIKEIKEILA